MKKRMKQWIALLTVLCMVLAIGMPASAAGQPKLSASSYKFSYAKGNSYNYGVMKIKNFTSGMTVKNITSTNSGVATAFLSEKGTAEIIVRPAKAGKVTIAGDFYQGETKLSSFSAKVTIFKYKNPAKAFKLGKKNFTKKFKNNKSTFVSLSGKTKVSVKANKGWKLKSIYFMNGSSYKMIKNGKTISLTAGYGSITAKFYNKKQKRTEDLSISLFRY